MTFLRDEQTKQLRLPLAEGRRKHLHQQIDKAKLDLTHVTERRGSPYTLVLIRTTASFEAQLKIYHRDVDFLKRLHKLIGKAG